MNKLAPLDPAMDVSVVIVNWNGVQWLPQCLESLRGVEGIRKEVIVVDNASQDASVEAVRQGFREVELIVNSRNLGFAQGNNQGIRRGRGRHFFILNNDTILQPGCLESLVRFLDTHPRAGMVAGHLVDPDGSTQFRYYPVALPTLASLSADLLWLNRLWPRNRLGRGALARQWNPHEPSRMEQIPGACMLVRREAFEAVGLFDESYRFWYEDVDLCARCLRAGWEIWYVPEARIVHYGGASTKHLDLPSQSLLRFGSMLRYGHSYFAPLQFTLLKLVVGLVLVLRLLFVLGARLWPSATSRRFLKGVWQAYVQLLEELVTAPRTRSP